VARFTAPEHRAVRLAFAIVLLAILVGFWIVTRQFWIPAHGGADQNGYLVGGRMLADHGSAAQAPPDPYAFVGRMWVAAPDGRYFPKYPLGLPLLVAMVIKLAGPGAAYLISPIAMLLALLGVFLLARLIAGSFAGLLATLIVATSPVTLGLANNPNSHATALCLVTWGFFLLLGYWQRPGFSRAALAGLLIGLAATVRYSEGTHGLSVLLVACFTLRRSRAHAGTLLVAWAAPILFLLMVNRVTMGTWTGYGPTGESTGFALEHLAQNWDVLLRQLASTGLFLTLPVGVLGLILLFAWSARLALLLWAWLLPGLLVYAAYYWAPDNSGIGYARFFLTLFPPLALGAAWSLTQLAPVAPHAARTYQRIIAPVAALVLVLGAGAYNVWSAIPMLAADGRKAATVARAADQVMRVAKAPPGSVVFGPREFLHHLQFVADYRLYAADEFDRRTLATLEEPDPTRPAVVQPSRAAALIERLKTHDDRQLARLLRDITAEALDDHCRVFVISPADAPLPQRFDAPEFDVGDGRAFTARPILTWTEPPPLPDRLRRRPGPSGRSFADAYDPALPPITWQLTEMIRRAQ
jgi:hypothetical protein